LNASALNGVQKNKPGRAGFKPAPTTISMHEMKRPDNRL
jgi:hypothetical protein